MWTFHRQRQIKRQASSSSFSTSSLRFCQLRQWFALDPEEPTFQIILSGRSFVCSSCAFINLCDCANLRDVCWQTICCFCRAAGWLLGRSDGRTDGREVISLGHPASYLRRVRCCYANEAPPIKSSQQMNVVRSRTVFFCFALLRFASLCRPRKRTKKKSLNFSLSTLRAGEFDSNFQLQLLRQRQRQMQMQMQSSAACNEHPA